MVKNDFYLRHDLHARGDSKIVKLRRKFGIEGYGLFWMILETLFCEGGYITEEDFVVASLEYGDTNGIAMGVLQFGLEIGLFKKDKQGRIYNNRILGEIDFRTTQSKNGKKGAKMRWKDTKKNSDPNGDTNGDTNATGNAKERKGKERLSFQESSRDPLNAVTPKQKIKKPKNLVEATTLLLDFYFDELDLANLNETETNILRNIATAKGKV